MLRTLLFSVAVVASLGAVAYADDHRHGDFDDRPGPGWISTTEAAHKLHDLGYGEIVKLKADDGYWKAKVLRHGAMYKVRLDPRTGQVVSEWHDDDGD